MYDNQDFTTQAPEAQTSQEEELRRKYGKLYTVNVDIEVDDFTTDQKSYLFRKPSAVSFDRLVKKISVSPTKAAEDFVLDTIIPEEADRLRADLEEYPGLALTVNDKLTSMLGLSKGIAVKKF